MNALIYDIEIVRAIPNKDGSRLEGIEYCAGWHDHANMGVSVIGAYDYGEDRYRAFCQDNFGEFMKLVAACELLVGFNSIPFDNRVLDVELGEPEWSMPADRCYDLLRETWAAAGLGPDFQYPSHAGYGLDAICARNFGTKKSGNGALAPVLWQRGQIGDVIDYCLNDIRLTKQLFDAVLQGRPIISPVTAAPLRLRNPFTISRIAADAPR